MNNNTTYSNYNQIYTTNSSLFNKKHFTRNHKARNRHNSIKYQHFTQQRSPEKQLLLEAILGLLRREAKKAGLEKEAIQLEHKILKRNYLQQRS